MCECERYEVCDQCAPKPRATVKFKLVGDDTIAFTCRSGGMIEVASTTFANYQDGESITLTLNNDQRGMLIKWLMD